MARPRGSAELLEARRRQAQRKQQTPLIRYGYAYAPELNPIEATWHSVKHPLANAHGSIWSAGGLSGDIVKGVLPLTPYAIAHFKNDDEGQRSNGSPYGFQFGRAGL